jgi:hypothetical protein
VSLVVRNARLLDGRLVDLLAEDGRWTRIGESIAADGSRELDADRRLVTPPLVDCHVHLDAHADGCMPEDVLQPEFAAALRGRSRESLSRLLGDEEGDRPARSLQYLFRQTLRRKTLPGAQLFVDDLAPRDPYDDFDLIEFCRRMPRTARRGGSLQRAYISRFGALGMLPSPKDGVPPALMGVRRRAAVVGVRVRTAAQERVDARIGVAWRPDRRGIGDYATDLRAAGAELLGLLLERRTLERGQICEDAVRRLVGETLAGRARNTRVLGMLVTLELFQRQFLEGERPQAST